MIPLEAVIALRVHAYKMVEPLTYNLQKRKAN